VWQRRQGPAPMEGVERTNVVVVREQGQWVKASLRRDSYVMEVDCERNCYAYGGFGHMARHCRNRGQRGRVKQGRRVEYRRWSIKGNNRQTGHLKEVENLEFLD